MLWNPCNSQVKGTIYGKLVTSFLWVMVASRSNNKNTTTVKFIYSVLTTFQALSKHFIYSSAKPSEMGTVIPTSQMRNWGSEGFRYLLKDTWQVTSNAIRPFMLFFQSPTISSSYQWWKHPLHTHTESLTHIFNVNTYSLLLQRENRRAWLVPPT